MATPRDLELARQAETLLLDFLHRPGILRLLGNPTIDTVNTYEENWMRGDIRLTWDNGAIQYVEHKAVNHNLLVGIPTRHLPDATFHDASNTFATTIVEVAKGRDSSPMTPALLAWRDTLASHLGYPTWQVLAAVPLHDARRTRPTDDCAIPPFTVMPVGNFAWQAHSNLHPYAQGTIAAFVDVNQKSINFHSGRDLLARTRASIDKNGLFYSPGRTDPDTLLARKVPYGPTRFIQDTTGAWWNVGPVNPVTDFIHLFAPLATSTVAA